ncbi:MAG: hypothetical protein E7310_03935 [Clostridiales bacterium]|nr:hypothetical protein [Clostridiales bacterium]
MKVLFAVNNDEISNAIIKKYQKEYKEIISYKNVYYFNAIIKELQKDSTYDRIVISEELEPFANNNYDTIDKFIFEKLDNISDEATNKSGNDIEIILICSDRRTKSDEILIKLFGIGIYSAIVGNDRSIDEVCRLIRTPRIKKDAKQYYKIDSENVMYQVESENNVSEAEVQNILAHYKRLGKNEDKYVDSFNNIVSQYTDAQLKIIIRYLPMSVKAVLEERSPKYQSLVTFSNKGRAKQASNQDNNRKEKNNLNVKMLEKESTKQNIKKPIVIPSKMDLNSTKKIMKQEQNKNQSQEDDFIDLTTEFDMFDDEESTNDNAVIENKQITEEKVDNIIEKENKIEEEITEQPKRGRGRPRKNPIEENNVEDKPKRGRGRPRKNPIEENKETELDEEDLDLFDIEEKAINNKEDDLDLFDELDEIEEESLDLFEEDDEIESEDQDDSDELDLFGDDDNDDELDLFGNDEEENYDELDLFGNDDNEEDDDELDLFSDITNEEKKEEDFFANDNQSKDMNSTEMNFNDNNDRRQGDRRQGDRRQIQNDFISKDKKIAAFVGTTKNGTSFIVNNLAELLSSMGISTAILDMSKNKNAYYIYTDNNENLRQVASNCMYKLKTNVAEGIQVNKNLSIFTDIPGEEKEYTTSEIDTILNTLTQRFSVVLIDCDFQTASRYFEKAQEIYLVQSMDVLTIQPLTAFLKQLKNRNILKQEKLRVVINKEQKMKNLPLKLLIAGISKYNSPDMTLMDELFNKDTINYCTVPFEMQNYSKYLEGLVECSLSLNGYTKQLISALRGLADMVYPLGGRTTYTPRTSGYNNNFSSEVNTTLDRMKKNYQ